MIGRSGRVCPHLLALAAFALTPLVVSVQGCTAVGLLGGVLIDSARQPERGIIPAGRSVRVFAGQDVSVRLADGRTIDGVFVGTRRSSTDAYVERYAKWRDAASAPAIGDTIEVDAGRRLLGTFRGFRLAAIAWAPLSGRAASSIALIDVRRLSWRGGSRSGASLRDSALAGALPVMDAIGIAWDGVSRERAGTRFRRVTAGRETLWVGADEAEVALALGDSPFHRVTPLLTVAGVMTDAAILAAFASYDGPFGNASGCESVNLGYTHLELGDAPFDRLAGRFLAPGEPAPAEATEVGPPPLPSAAPLASDPTDVGIPAATESTAPGDRAAARTSAP